MGVHVRPEWVFTFVRSWCSPSAGMCKTRILFYMDLRYDGNDSSGAADLILNEQGGSDKRYLRGVLTAQRWHCNDPVSDRERAINESAYMLQGNRNPFVDRPHWAEHLFGFNC